MNNIHTDRAPNTYFYFLTSYDSGSPNIFNDPDLGQTSKGGKPVGGVVTPSNWLTVLSPYLVLVGLITILSTIHIIKQKKISEHV